MVISDQSAGAAGIETRIDPNTAGWAELASLPGIGESLARQIVAYRDQQQAAKAGDKTAAGPVFRSIKDLDPIPGLGEKKLRRLEPYLRFSGG